MSFDKGLVQASLLFAEVLDQESSVVCCRSCL